MLGDSLITGDGALLNTSIFNRYGIYNTILFCNCVDLPGSLKTEFEAISDNWFFEEIISSPPSEEMKTNLLMLLGVG